MSRTEAPKVHGEACFLTEKHLGSQVLGSSYDGELLVKAVAGFLRQVEVGYSDVAVLVDQHVFRLQTAISKWGTLGA